jgi:quercetin dioxygenase-like cupin family protein
MRRLMVFASVLLILGVTPLLAQQQRHVAVTPDDLKWVEPATLPGAKMAVVLGDPGKEGPFVYRLKAPADYKVPPHFHKAAENVTVLSGTFYIGVGEKFDPASGQKLPAGGFASIPATHPHFAWTTTEETVVQVHGVGPTDLTFVNPADDPRKK